MKSKLFLTIILLFAVTACTANGKSASLEISDESPTATSTPNPTITSEPTITASSPTETVLPPTQIPTPTVVPPATITPNPSPTPVLEGLPVTSKDLLFIADGSLKIWRHNPAQIDTLIIGGTATSTDEQFGEQRRMEPLIGDVTTLSVSGDGTQAVIAQLVNETRYFPDSNKSRLRTMRTYQIILINLDNEEQHLLLSTFHSRPRLALSSNGDFLAIGGSNISLLETLRQIMQVNGALYIMKTTGNSTPELIDNCDLVCGSAIWHPTNNLFVYENDGLKMYDLTTTATELLIDGTANGEYEDQYFVPRSWASNGRYLLMYHGSSGNDGGDRVIFDLPTKQIITIPGSSVYVRSGKNMAWMRDSRLFTIGTHDEQQAVGEIWHIDIDSNQLLLDETDILSTSRNHPAAPVHLENGTFAYALFNLHSPYGTMNGNSSGLYHRSSFYEESERLNNVPALTDYFPTIVWEDQNGTGLIVSDNGSMWYVGADGSSVQNMETAVSGNAHSFHWLP